MKRAAKWIAQVEQTQKQPSINYNRDKYLAMVARLPHGTPAERGVIEGNKYTNAPFGVSLEVPAGWKLDNSRAQALVTLSGPVPEVRGLLQRFALPGAMGVKEFA